MKSSKSKVKSMVQATLLGAGLLMATSVFADNHSHGRDFDGRSGHQSQDRSHRDHDDWGHRDFDRHDHDRDDHRGGIRLVLPLPPRPTVFLPIPRPPHVSFSVVAPSPVYITYARVVDVDPIITRSYGNWDDYRDDYRDDRRGGRVDGYRVTYEFQGLEYTTVMSYDPGDRVRIRVGHGIEVLG